MFVFFNDTATPEIYTLSLHDALPIFVVEVATRLVRVRADEARRDLAQAAVLLATARGREDRSEPAAHAAAAGGSPVLGRLDRKSTRLNSSHANISYAVFCLKKKNNTM